MSENLNCPCCAKEPIYVQINDEIYCDNRLCLIYRRFIPASVWNNPDFRIAEREAEKRGVARGKAAGIKLALSICDQAYHQSQHDADVQVTPESFACNEAVSDCKKQIQSLLK